MTIIAWLARLLGGRTWLAWLLTAASVAGVLGCVYAYVDHQGYKRATLEWSQKYDRREAELQTARFKELDRQAAANDAAKAAEAARLREMADRLAELEAAAIENDRAAEADPNASRIGLGADSVERLNRIR